MSISHPPGTYNDTYPLGYLSGFRSIFIPSHRPPFSSLHASATYAIHPQPAHTLEDAEYLMGTNRNTLALKSMPHYDYCHI